MLVLENILYIDSIFYIDIKLYSENEYNQAMKEINKNI